MTCRLTRRTSVFLTLAGCLALAGGPWAVGPSVSQAKVVDTKAKEAEPPPAVVIRFVGAQKGRHLGREVLMVSGQNALDGKPVQIPIHNTDDNANKYDPRPRDAEVATGAKPGDYLRIEPEVQSNQTWVRKIEPYKLGAGEDQPNVFVLDADPFTQKEGDVEYTVVPLRKFGQTVNAAVPMKKEKQQSVPDPAIAARVTGLKKDAAVEAQFTPGRPYATLSSIDAYTAAAPAKFQKLGDSEVEGAKYPTADFDQDGKTVSLPLAGKTVGKKLTPDPKLLAAVKALKPGADVLIRTREEDGKTWLRDVQKPPTAAKPAKGNDAKPAAPAKPAGAKGK